MTSLTKNELIQELEDNLELDILHIECFHKLVSKHLSFSLLTVEQIQFPKNLVDVRSPNSPSF